MFSGLVGLTSSCRSTCRARVFQVAPRNDQLDLAQRASMLKYGEAGSLDSIWLLFETILWVIGLFR